jgi:hypothetical protein
VIKFPMYLSSAPSDGSTSFRPSTIHAIRQQGSGVADGAREELPEVRAQRHQVRRAAGLGLVAPRGRPPRCGKCAAA